MKFQFAIINPDHVAENDGQYSGRTFMMGIAKSNEKLADFCLSTMVIGMKDDKPLSFFIPNQDNLVNRAASIDLTSFETLTTNPLWMQGQCEDCLAGDITYIGVPPIEADPEHQHHYLVMGMLTGPMDLLRSLSGRILEVDRPEFSTLPDLHQEVVDTGRPAEHILGSHLNTLIEQPIWGFGSKKAGAAYSVTPQAAHEQFSALRQFADTGVLPDGDAYARLRADKAQQNYVRTQHRLSPMSYHYWETAEEKKARRAFALQALMASLNEPDIGMTIR